MGGVNRLKIQAILFDLDGVIINSHEAIAMAVRDTIKVMGLPFRNDIERVVFSRSHRMAFIEVYPDHEYLVDTFDRLYINNPLNYKVTLLPHVKNILYFTVVWDIKTAIVTTKDKYRTSQILKNLNLKFEAIITCDDTKKTRPDPSPINLALQKLNLSKRGILYVGDTPLDVIQAKKAGIISVAITTGSYKSDELKRESPDFIIDNINQLIGLVEEYER